MFFDPFLAQTINGLFDPKDYELMKKEEKEGGGKKKEEESTW